ncbi:MAG: SLC13 family permease [Leptospiraceae bacterium]|nr:SLC13 family permease [Leptospiraceae bacterium]
MKKFGFYFGILLFLVLVLWSPETSLSKNGFRTGMVALLMAVFWITEAIPVYATALFPLVLFPILSVSNIAEVSVSYSNPIIFLFLGGFFLATGLESTNLHKRIAIHIILLFGDSKKSILLGFLIATMFISMWVNNTSTALMMLPIGTSVILVLRVKERDINFETSLMLFIAYGSSIGGLCTIIGTTPNVFLVGYLKQNFQITINFIDWLWIGLPIFIITIPVLYFLFTIFLFPIKNEERSSKEYLENELKLLGKFSIEQYMVTLVFLLVVFGWIFHPIIAKNFPIFTDASISMAGAVLLFILPISFKEHRFLLDANSIHKIPWDSILLFGGGLSLANIADKSGLASWIGVKLSSFTNLPEFVLVVIIITLVVFLTELTSNLATTAALLPVVSALATTMGVNQLLFTIPVTIAASCAFMFPVATPPNAIVYGSKMVDPKNMAKAGFILNLIYIVLITTVTYLIIIPVFKIR